MCGIPVLSFFALLVLAHLSRDDGFFLMFQVLALIAAYHFVKQQIGVTLLYARRDVSHSPLLASRLKSLDKMIVWIATGVPLAYWISHSKELDLIWFVEGEFDVLSPLFQKLDLFILLSILAVFVYIFAQFYAIRLGRYRPNPLKYLYIMMTAFIW